MNIISNISSSDIVAMCLAFIGGVFTTFCVWWGHKLTASRENRRMSKELKRQKGEELLNMLAVSMRSLPTSCDENALLNEKIVKNVDDILLLASYFPEFHYEIGDLVEIATRIYVLIKEGLYVESRTFFLNKPFQALTEGLPPRVSADKKSDMVELTHEYLVAATELSSKVSMVIQKSI